MLCVYVCVGSFPDTAMGGAVSCRLNNAGGRYGAAVFGGSILNHARYGAGVFGGHRLKITKSFCALDSSGTYSTGFRQVSVNFFGHIRYRY